MGLGLAAAGIAVAAACATSDATMAASPPPPTVAVVLDVGGCADTDTLGLCEGIRHAIRRTGLGARILSPTFRDDLGDFLALIADHCGRRIEPPGGGSTAACTVRPRAR